ncbi:PREDICTED: odorant receptor 10a-like isoform X2 [Vollenhovia emeryi]|uniref:odorant receptor 10a-like isoform X2 n=1 Tax=Vollenhovia emeryi TaxID=411798 RepID=UPI0005F57042|nr:PREDICTED: odorant receptor 10a-like isoform X2 [Vollenhovia emeryi]
MRSSTNWNTDTTNSLKFHKNFLGIIGLWVLDEKSVFSKIRWFLSTTVELSTLITMSLELILHCKGPEDAMDAFLLCSSSLVSMVKLLLHRVYWRQKFILVESIIHDWTSVKNSYSRDIMLKYARIVLQFVQVVVNGISQCGNDGFFFHLTMHMCGQFAILRVNFTKLGCEEFPCRTKFDILLKRHYHLIYLSHYLERAFTLVILAQILMSVLVLCIAGFLLMRSLEMNDTFTAAKHSVFVFALLLQLFIYCFAGETLEFQSKGLAYAIYKSPWYTFDIRAMKNLPLIILRTTNPQQLTARKFVAMNLMTFKEILKASASYLSVLRVMIKA